MKKILSVFGTRPEAIKMAPLVRVLGQEADFESKVLATAQHREMLDQVLSLFEITPDFDFNLMKANQSLSSLTSSILEESQKLFQHYRPDIVLVHGDTTTSFATTLACFYNKIPVAHVEAGLRTYNLQSPFPEEFNRQVTSKLAALHFCPTQSSKDNLIREGISSHKISVTGNTVIDSLLFIKNKIDQNSALSSEIQKSLKILHGIDIDELGRYILITGHRRENFGDGFIQICQAIKEVAQSYPEISFVYPVHLNPQVKKPVEDILSNLLNIKLIAPLDYLHFVYLMDRSYIILTDSGGIQEEAPSLGKPVLVMRDTTERPEAVESGAVRLVGAKKDSIVSGLEELITDEKVYLKMSQATNPYGDGNASSNIINSLKSFMSLPLKTGLND